MGGTLKATVSGKLSRDPEMTFSEKGTALTKLSIPVDDYNFSTKETSTRWITVTAFGQLAERLDKSCKKGTVVMVTGRYEPRLFKNKENKPQIGHDLVADSCEIVAWPPKSGSSDSNGSSSGSDDNWDLGDLDDHPF